MPIYEYQCEACGHELEALQKLSDAPLVECPHCKAPKLHKKISAAGFRLKGGGWYETDFKSAGKKNLAGESAAAPAADSAKPAAPAASPAPAPAKSAD
jgi:putative FmdB family regulatory protein